jgi:hypothetical protein
MANSVGVAIASDQSNVPALLDDQYITGQGSQTTSGRNVILATAGTAATDTKGYRGIAIQINVASGTVTAGAITFEGSNDNTNFFSIFLRDLTSVTSDPVSSYTLAASTNRLFGGPIPFRYIKARISTGITGTTTGVQAFTVITQEPWNYAAVPVSNATAASLKVDGSGVTQPVSIAAALPVTDNGGNLSIDDGGNSITVDNAGTFAVQDSDKVTDNAGFTDGTTKVQPAGYVFDETAGTALTENDAAAARVDSKRAQVLVIEDETTRGRRATVTVSNALKVDGSAVTQPVSGTFWQTTQPVSLASGATAIAKAEDDASANADVGVPAMAIRKATPANTSGTDGDYEMLQMSAGRLWASTLIDTALPAGTNNIGLVTPTPSTTGGWSKVKYAANTTTVQTVKSSAGTFGGYYVYNPNTSVAYVQVFDVSGTVTLGTTAPDMIFAIPAGSGANLEITCGVNMANAIKLACSTTATGNTAPSTGLDITIFYK